MTQRIVTVTVLVVALVALWRYWPSDERQIQRLVQEMAGAVQPGADETDIARLGRLAPLAHALSADVVVEGPTPARGRDQVMAVAMQGGRAAPRLSIVVRDVDIQVEPGRATATALVTVAISGGTTGRLGRHHRASARPRPSRRRVDRHTRRTRRRSSPVATEPRSHGDLCHRGTEITEFLFGLLFTRRACDKTHPGGGLGPVNTRRLHRSIVRR